MLWRDLDWAPHSGQKIGCRLSTVTVKACSRRSTPTMFKPAAGDHAIDVFIASCCRIPSQGASWPASSGGRTRRRLHQSQSDPDRVVELPLPGLALLIAFWPAENLVLNGVVAPIRSTAHRSITALTVTRTSSTSRASHSNKKPSWMAAQVATPASAKRIMSSRIISAAKPCTQKLRPVRSGDLVEVPGRSRMVQPSGVKSGLQVTAFCALAFDLAKKGGGFGVVA